MVSALCVVMVVVTQDDEGGDLAEVESLYFLVIFFNQIYFSVAEVDICCFPHFSLFASITVSYKFRWMSWWTS